MRGVGKNERRVRRDVATSIVLVGLALACGCAYFNTFYNAKSQFKKAEQERISSTGTQGAESYQRCIEKCQLLLRYYRKSKYVDDALYLIGLSHLYRDEYVQARASLEELIQRFPKSEYVERAYYHIGLASLEQGDTAGAATAFATLQTQFPDSKLNIEAVFRSADAKFEMHDYDAARAAMQAFLHDHPKSDLAGEAQLHLARSYYDERRYKEARVEYARVLELGVDAPTHFEAQMNEALSQRALAEETLGNPALQRRSRMRRAASDLEKYEAKLPAPAAPSETFAGPDSAEEGSTPPPAPAPVPIDTTAVAPLTDAETEALRAAEHELDDVGAKLVLMRKPGAKLGRQVDVDIEIAVTRALRGEPADAVADLDQIARSQPRTEISARARYESGEIYRRLGDFARAQKAYDESLKEKPQSTVSERAQRKSTAIVARGQAAEGLRGAPEIIARWKAVAGHEFPDLSATSDSTAADSLGARIALEGSYEELARQQLRVAEIDLLELDQALIALREFQEVLDRYPGSLQGPRASFGVAWIYHHRLRDPERAKQAYAAVVRDHADSPQGREAKEILDRWAEHGMPEVEEPSSRP